MADDNGSTIGQRVMAGLGVLGVAGLVWLGVNGRLGEVIPHSLWGGNDTALPGGVHGEGLLGPHARPPMDTIWPTVHGIAPVGVWESGLNSEL